MLSKTKPEFRNKLKFTIFLISLLLLFGSTSDKKISRLFEKADSYYNESNYSLALKLYNKIMGREGFNGNTCLQAARYSRSLEDNISSNSIKILKKVHFFDKYLFFYDEGLFL